MPLCNLDSDNGVLGEPCDRYTGHDGWHVGLIFFVAPWWASNILDRGPFMSPVFFRQENLPSFLEAIALVQESITCATGLIEKGGVESTCLRSMSS